MSDQQKAFYDVIMSAINDGHKISIGVVNNSDQVDFGSWEYSQIDVADIRAVGEGEGMNMYSIIGHEIAEQTYKQTNNNPTYCMGHCCYGLEAEYKISGYIRNDIGDFLNCYITNYNNYLKNSSIIVITSFNEDKSIKSVSKFSFPSNLKK